MIFPQEQYEVQAGQIREQLFHLDITPRSYDIEEDIVSMLLGGTNRKAPPLGEVDRGHPGGWYNRIPSDITGPCSDILVAYCFDNDSFKERMNDVVKHIAVCPQTIHVIIITSQWNPKEWRKNHESYFQQIRARVNICLFAFNKLHHIT